MPKYFGERALSHSPVNIVENQFGKYRREIARIVLLVYLASSLNLTLLELGHALLHEFSDLPVAELEHAHPHANYWEDHPWLDMISKSLANGEERIPFQDFADTSKKKFPEFSPSVAYLPLSQNGTDFNIPPIRSWSSDFIEVLVPPPEVGLPFSNI